MRTHAYLSVDTTEGMMGLFFSTGILGFLDGSELSGGLHHVLHLNYDGAHVLQVMDDIPKPLAIDAWEVFSVRIYLGM